jgi:hypothetical protein
MCSSQGLPSILPCGIARTRRGGRHPRAAALLVLVRHSRRAQALVHAPAAFRKRACSSPTTRSTPRERSLATARPRGHRGGVPPSWRPTYQARRSGPFRRSSRRARNCSTRIWGGSSRRSDPYSDHVFLQGPVSGRSRGQGPVYRIRVSRLSSPRGSRSGECRRWTGRQPAGGRPARSGRESSARWFRDGVKAAGAVHRLRDHAPGGAVPVLHQRLGAGLADRPNIAG